MEEINKFLTEAMPNGCWHEIPQDFIYYSGEGYCTLCQRSVAVKYASAECVNNDFSTWQGMGKLREFYDTWSGYKKRKFRAYVYYNRPAIVHCDYIWHKDNTANLMYGFLKELDA
ncbi:MAG: hypothetical protein KAR06_05865 [Deltaproteobacteria bacterium]|nr:hypothetical protein [Deltaproteobacteria bacterium]